MQGEWKRVKMHQLREEVAQRKIWQNLTEESAIICAVGKLNWKKNTVYFLFQKNEGKHNKVTVMPFHLMTKNNHGPYCWNNWDDKNGFTCIKNNWMCLQEKNLARKESNWKLLNVVIRVLCPALNGLKKSGSWKLGLQDQLLYLYYFTCSLRICYWWLWETQHSFINTLVLPNIAMLMFL